MQQFSDTLIDLQGNVIPGAAVRVLEKTTGALAKLYGTPGGAEMPNPFYTSTSGSYAFYAANGRYQTEYVVGSRTFPGYRDILLYDPEDGPAAMQPIKDDLDALQLPDYAALRAYKGPRKSVYVTGVLGTAAPSGIAGMFVRDDADTATADNSGTCFVTVDGKRFKRVFDGAINAVWFGAKEGAADSAAAINAAAVACRASGRALLLPTVATFYTISTTVDLSDIKIIDGKGAELRGTFSGIPAAIIGGTATSFRGADIHLKVRNAPDKSSVAGTDGIKFLNASNSRFAVYARGFDVGLHFDGATANRVWVDNRIDVLELYNCGSPVHFNFAGTTYMVKNQFVGGSFYTGHGEPVAGRGTFKVTLAGSGQLADVVVQSPEIGVDVGSCNPDYGVFVHATVGSTWDTNTIEFKDARFEGYGAYSFSPYAVNIAANTAGRIGVAIELSGSVSSGTNSTNFQIAAPPLKQNKVRLVNTAIRAQGAMGYPQVIVPNEAFPYQTSGRCYVPGRVIYGSDTGYNAPKDYFAAGFFAGSSSRAIGDGDLISGATTDSFGLIYSKSTNDVAFIDLHQPEEFAVVCFDASGNVLSGVAPYYAVGQNYRSVARGAVSIYEFNGRWLWLHKDVASFYIGAARWASNGRLRDIAFSVLYGANITKRNDVQTSPRNMVAHVAPSQSFMPVGAAVDGVASNGWRNTFYLRTTTTLAAASGATTVELATVTGITAGDTIGIELDAEIAPGLRRYHYAAVSSVSGNTVTLAAALTASVAIGRTILVNRWVVR